MRSVTGCVGFSCKRDSRTEQGSLCLKPRSFPLVPHRGFSVVVGCCFIVVAVVLLGGGAGGGRGGWLLIASVVGLCPRRAVSSSFLSSLGLIPVFRPSAK